MRKKKEDANARIKYEFLLQHLQNGQPLRQYCSLGSCVLKLAVKETELCLVCYSG